MLLSSVDSTESSITRLANHCSLSSPLNPQGLDLLKSHQLDGSSATPVSPPGSIDRPLETGAPHLLQPANLPPNPKILLVPRLLLPQPANLPPITRQRICVPNRLPLRRKEQQLSSK